MLMWSTDNELTNSSPSRDSGLSVVTDSKCYTSWMNAWWNSELQCLAKQKPVTNWRADVLICDLCHFDKKKRRRKHGWECSYRRNLELGLVSYALFRFRSMLSIHLIMNCNPFLLVALCPVQIKSLIRGFDSKKQRRNKRYQEKYCSPPVWIQGRK